MDEELDDSAESQLIQAFADFVRSLSSGEGPTTAAPGALLSIADAARYLNVSVTTVRNLAIGNKVRSARVGDRIRFRRVWLDEWIDAGGGEVPAPTPSPPRPATEPRKPCRSPDRSTDALSRSLGRQRSFSGSATRRSVSSRTREAVGTAVSTPGMSGFGPRSVGRVGTGILGSKDGREPTCARSA